MTQPQRIVIHDPEAGICLFGKAVNRYRRESGRSTEELFWDFNMAVALNLAELTNGYTLADR